MKQQAENTVPGVIPEQTPGAFPVRGSQEMLLFIIMHNGGTTAGTYRRIRALPGGE